MLRLYMLGFILKNIWRIYEVGKKKKVFNLTAQFIKHYKLTNKYTLLEYKKGKAKKNKGKENNNYKVLVFGFWEKKKEENKRKVSSDQYSSSFTSSPTSSLPSFASSSPSSSASSSSSIWAT